jgi:hypothetical protein
MSENEEEIFWTEEIQAERAPVVAPSMIALGVVIYLFVGCGLGLLALGLVIRFIRLIVRWG